MNRFARESFTFEYKQQTRFLQRSRQNAAEDRLENPDSLNSLTVVARSLAGILGLCFVSAFPSFSTAAYVHNSRDEGVKKPPNKQISKQPLGRDSRQRHHQARNILDPGKKREAL